MNCLIKIFGWSGFIVALGAVGKIDYCVENGCKENPVSWVFLIGGSVIALICYFVVSRRANNEGKSV